MCAWLVAAAVARSPTYEPADAVRACLDGAYIFAAGPSELASLLGWLTGADTIATRRNTVAMQQAEATMAVSHNKNAASRSLACSTRRNLADRHYQCMGSYRKRAVCREDLYSRKPFEANCSGATRHWRGARFRLLYMWKSFQFSAADVLLRDAARAALRTRRKGRVIVVLSAGLQQFLRGGDEGASAAQQPHLQPHRESLLHNVRDDEPWPQPWIDRYVNETAQLFRLYSAEARAANACIAWRTQNVAPRHSNGSEPRHHPSAGKCGQPGCHERVQRSPTGARVSAMRARLRARTRARARARTRARTRTRARAHTHAHAHAHAQPRDSPLTHTTRPPAALQTPRAAARGCGHYGR